MDGSFATYLGWVLPWGTPVTLLGQTAEQVARAQRELARIGIDRPAAAGGGPEQWSDGRPLARLRRATFADLAAAAGPGGADGEGGPGGPGGRLVVLDVRRRLEWADGHVAGAVHIPFSELPARPASCRRAKSGSTARAATGPRWPPRSWLPADAR